MDSMKQYNNGVEHQRSNFKRVVQNDRTDFDEFVNDNTNVGDDDHKFSSMGQGNMFGPNKARINISLRRCSFLSERIPDILGIIMIHVEI